MVWIRHNSKISVWSQIQRKIPAWLVKWCSARWLTTINGEILRRRHVDSIILRESVWRCIEDELNFRSLTHSPPTMFPVNTLAFPLHPLYLSPSSNLTHENMEGIYKSFLIFNKQMLLSLLYKQGALANKHEKMWTSTGLQEKEPNWNVRKERDQTK